MDFLVLEVREVEDGQVQLQPLEAVPAHCLENALPLIQRADFCMDNYDH